MHTIIHEHVVNKRLEAVYISKDALGFIREMLLEGKHSTGKSYGTF